MSSVVKILYQWYKQLFFNWRIVVHRQATVFKCVFFWLHGFCGKWEGWDPVNWFKHTSWMAIITPTDRLKSVRNRCIIEVFGGVFVLSRCFLDYSIGVWAFVIGLGQISSFFYLERSNVKVKATARYQWKMCVTMIKHAEYHCFIINTSEDMSQVKVFVTDRHTNRQTAGQMSLNVPAAKCGGQLKLKYKNYHSLHGDRYVNENFKQPKYKKRPTKMLAPF